MKSFQEKQKKNKAPNKIHMNIGRKKKTNRSNKFYYDANANNYKVKE